MWLIVLIAVVVAVLYVVDRKLILNGVHALEWEVEVLKARFAPKSAPPVPAAPPQPAPASTGTGVAPAVMVTVAKV